MSMVCGGVDVHRSRWAAKRVVLCGSLRLVRATNHPCRTSALPMQQHYFARAFHPTRNTLIDTIRIVVEDMKVRRWPVKDTCDS